MEIWLREFWKFIHEINDSWLSAKILVQFIVARSNAQVFCFDAESSIKLCGQRLLEMFAKCLKCLENGK